VLGPRQTRWQRSRRRPIYFQVDWSLIQLHQLSYLEVEQLVRRQEQPREHWLGVWTVDLWEVEPGLELELRLELSGVVERELR
jgi:hypothetical protein